MRSCHFPSAACCRALFLLKEDNDLELFFSLDHTASITQLNSNFEVCVGSTRIRKH